MRLYSQVTGKYYRASLFILNEVYFPEGNEAYGRIEKPYSIQLDGFVGDRTSYGGRINFKDFNIFQIWVLNIIHLPPADYWRK